jgi:hypothetical protein
MTVGEGLVKEQFMQFFHMETKYSKPTHTGLDGIEEKSSPSFAVSCNSKMQIPMTNLHAVIKH